MALLKQKVNGVWTTIPLVNEITVDSAISDTSENPVQNKVIKSYIDNVGALGLTAATVGQIIKVKAVDESGKPTAWEAADSPVMKITVTGDESSCVADKTFQEILDAYNAGIFIYAVMPDLAFGLPLVVSEEHISFVNTYVSDDRVSVQTDSLIINSNNSVEWSLNNLAHGSVTIITLLASGWTGTDGDYTQSVTVSGIIADTTKQLVNVNPYNDRGQLVAICDANIICASQGTNTLTFSAESIPTIDIQFIVEWKSINYVA